DGRGVFRCRFVERRFGGGAERGRDRQQERGTAKDGDIHARRAGSLTFKARGGDRKRTDMRTVAGPAGAGPGSAAPATLRRPAAENRRGTPARRRSGSSTPRPTGSVARVPCRARRVASPGRRP